MHVVVLLLRFYFYVFIIVPHVVLFACLLNLFSFLFVHRYFHCHTYYRNSCIIIVCLTFILFIIVPPVVSCLGCIFQIVKKLLMLMFIVDAELPWPKPAN